VLARERMKPFFAQAPDLHYFAIRYAAALLLKVSIEFSCGLYDHRGAYKSYSDLLHSLQFMPARAEPEQHGLSAEMSDARSVIQMLACSLEQDACDVAHPVMYLAQSLRGLLP
jgi:hypothetical protein